MVDFVAVKGVHDERDRWEDWDVLTRKDICAEMRFIEESIARPQAFHSSLFGIGRFIVSCVVCRWVSRAELVARRSAKEQNGRMAH